MDSRSPRWPSARIALALLVAAVAALAAGGCGSTAKQASAQSTFSVTGAAMGQPIPSGFVGLSIEIKSLEEYAGTNPDAVNPILLHLIEDIAPEQSPVLRLGGDSTDWSWWPVSSVARPPGVRFTLTPNWLDVARAVATAVRARLILGVDLEADNRTVATAEANAMVDRIGRSSVAALELGNEPELYGSFGWYRSASGKPVPGRPRDYDPAAFERDYSSFAARLPDVRLAGPSSGAPTWLAKLGSFLDAEPRVRLVTVHAYPLKHCTESKVVTIPQLLSEQSSRGLAASVAPYVAIAAAHHDPLRVDEMNGISCGGTRGVSDTFASALWVLDAMFEMARTGVTGVNIHTVPNGINEILGPRAAAADGAASRVHPEFYGMIMFAQAAPAGSHLLKLATVTPPRRQGMGHPRDRRRHPCRRHQQAAGRVAVPAVADRRRPRRGRGRAAARAERPQHQRGHDRRADVRRRDEHRRPGGAGDRSHRGVVGRRLPRHRAGGQRDDADDPRRITPVSAISGAMDLAAYLERIGVGPGAGLAEVHRAHVTSIPFENLDSAPGHAGVARAR